MLLQISKELINNIFKHSNATYIKYEIKLDENMVLIINCKSAVDKLKKEAINSLPELKF